MKLRHGGINLVQAAFRGYAALPPGRGNPEDDWFIVFGIDEKSSPEKVELTYKKHRAHYHPDKSTGDAAKFDEVQKAWEQYKDGR